MEPRELTSTAPEPMLWLSPDRLRSLTYHLGTLYRCERASSGDTWPASTVVAASVSVGTAAVIAEIRGLELEPAPERDRVAEHLSIAAAHIVAALGSHGARLVLRGLDSVELSAGEIADLRPLALELERQRDLFLLPPPRFPA